MKRLAPEADELLKAGRELARIAEDDIQACGNQPPHPDDCPDCERERDANMAWARAVVGFRKWVQP